MAAGVELNRKSIELRGVRVHNLRNIDLDLPLGKLIVVTGVSGSGKSSLAFDTLYAEGQRRYIESFSTYARQFLDRLEKPDADRIEQIPPAIAISQNTAGHSRRSTVATATEIHDSLRLVYARAGTVVCGQCGREVRSDSPASVTDSLQSLAPGTRYQLCFFAGGRGGRGPFVGDQRTGLPCAPTIAVGDDPKNATQEAELQSLLQGLREDGFTRLIAGERSINLLDDLNGLSDMLPAFADEFLVVVDRLTAGSASMERIADSVELAFRRGQGRCAVLELLPDQSRTRLLTRLSQWETPGTPEPTGPAAESGAESTSAATPEPNAATCLQVDGQTYRLSRFSSSLVCNGCGQEFLPPEPRLFSFNSPLGACPRCHGFGSILPDSVDPAVAGSRAALQAGALVRCPDCRGQRLQPLALAVQVAGRNIAEVCRLTVCELQDWLVEYRRTALSHDQAVLKPILPQTLSRLDYLQNVGLGYLSLDRPMSTLSSGEAQRVALTAALGSSLVNTLYVLDEPTAGLHPRDTERLLAAVTRLRDARNTVVVVEHDELFMRRADQLIDVGPGAGREGGRVIFQGPPSGIEACPDSVTGDFLAGRRRVGGAVPQPRHTPQPVRLKLTGARHNNLANITVEFPLGVLCVVTGVSGSGKSSLVQDTLYPALCRALGNAAACPVVGECDGLTGAEQVAEVILVDQSPIGRTPRSNPATYLKIFDDIRGLFAQTAEAKVRDYKAGRFSFNTASGGRCPTCQGNGSVAIDMQFLPDVTMVCPDCRGTRFRREILEIKYRGLDISEVLALTVREAFPFFRGQSKLQRRLKLLKDVGLDYISLGQPASTISGGESQRLKLAAFLGRGTSARTLFLLDEPTTGLHAADVSQLLGCFDALLAGGHSLIVIEHNVDLMKSADYLIDLGPGAGPEGGRVVAQGTPEEVARVAGSVTGRYL